MISPVTLRMDQVLETASSNKPVYIQVMGAQAEDLNDCKQGEKVGNRPFALNLALKKAF